MPKKWLSGKVSGSHWELVLNQRAFFFVTIALQISSSRLNMVALQLYY